MMDNDPQPISFETIFYVLVCVSLALIIIAGVASSQLAPSDPPRGVDSMTESITESIGESTTESMTESVGESTLQP